MNAEIEAECKGSGSTSELERRIEALADRFETREKAAAVAGISTDQLRKYIDGTTKKPAFGPIARMAQAQGISLDWVWSGRGEIALITGARGPEGASGAVDVVILREVLAGLFDYEERQELRLGLEERARLAAGLYEYFTEIETPHDIRAHVGHVIKIVRYMGE